MADLTIKDATFGMNTEGAEQYIEDLRDHVLKKAGKELEQRTKDLDQQLRAVWQGNGRDNVYNQIKRDAETLSKKLSDLSNDLEKAFVAVRDSLDKFDKSINVESAIR